MSRDSSRLRSVVSTSRPCETRWPLRVSSAIANASSRTHTSEPSRASIRYSARSGSPVRQCAS